MRSAFLLLLVCLCSACAMNQPIVPVSQVTPPDSRIWSVAGGEPLSETALVTELRKADIVVLGEVHDNAEHHKAQAWLVSQLKPTGLAFEMIPEASEEGIAVFLEQGGEPAEIGPAIGWERLGWPDWELYRPIFAAWRAEVYTGGGIGRSVLRRATRDGASSALSDTSFLPALTSPLDAPTQAAMEAEMIDSHCGKLPVEAAPGMVRVQRLRDANFAAAAARAAAGSGDGTTVLITGNGHARSDRGVPFYLAAARPEVAVLSVGILEAGSGVPSKAEITAEPYDFIWLTEAADRPDPCLAFK